MNEERRLEIVELLKSRGHDISLSSANPRGASTPLQLASFNGHHDIVEHLLDRTGTSVGRIDPNDIFTSSCIAANREHFEVLRIIFTCVEKRDLGWTGQAYLSDSPLHIAARNGNRDMIQLMIRFKGKIDFGKICPTISGATAIFQAVQNNHLDCVKLLLNHYNLNVKRQSDYKSILHLAIDNDNPEMVFRCD